eukprot:CAMPEP_0206001854 /NCGR_PEP_ID=MMETSP1464-20131121/2376_1 /ASSEMBLY_ACC=CAM_ASM_001124 /TAXON_ID=119497 /ORGANISM="Exanthemachrysis gayraliae, Strain RCC1523" /LENGTH=235 /DNA_ID=CAMNT_0053375179 /DNA_START=35 /DNA_END=739 /DNA_ORIENTATION=-
MNYIDSVDPCVCQDFFLDIVVRPRHRAWPPVAGASFSSQPSAGIQFHAWDPASAKWLPVAGSTSIFPIEVRIGKLARSGAASIARCRQGAAAPAARRARATARPRPAAAEAAHANASNSSMRDACSAMLPPPPAFSRSARAAARSASIWSRLRCAASSSWRFLAAASCSSCSRRAAAAASRSFWACRWVFAAWSRAEGRRLGREPYRAREAAPSPVHGPVARFIPAPGGPLWPGA